MNILQPALLVPLFSSLYSGASLTPPSPTVPEGTGNAGDTASSGGPEGNGHVDIASYSSPGENRLVGDTASFQRPKAMFTSTFRDVARCPRPRPNFDGASDRDGNPRVVVRTRWTETQGHPAAAPSTGTARTEAMQ
jgi:hypothetical protein